MDEPLGVVLERMARGDGVVRPIAPVELAAGVGVVILGQGQDTATNAESSSRCFQGLALPKQNRGGRDGQRSMVGGSTRRLDGVPAALSGMYGCKAQRGGGEMV